MRIIIALLHRRRRHATWAATIGTADASRIIRDRDGRPRGAIGRSATQRTS